jgi:hypothetical protein
MAYDGLMASRWFQLWDEPWDRVRDALASPLRAARDTLLAPLLRRVSSVAVDMVVNEVEGGFDRDEVRGYERPSQVALSAAWGL